MFKLFVLAVVAFGGVTGLDNGLARTPPMGWMNWQRYRCETDCDKYPDECVRYEYILHNFYFFTICFCFPAKNCLKLWPIKWFPMVT